MDKHGNLFVTGRVKESILLPNGKKISPTDVDFFYGDFVPGKTIACCGVPKENGTFDEVHMFVQTKGLTEEEAQQIVEIIHKTSQETKTLYRLNGIHKIETIPMTRVGKVKRFALRDMVKHNDAYNLYVTEDCLQTDGDDVEKKVRQVILDIVNHPLNVTKEATLAKDLDMDSLELFELSARLESLYGKKVMNVLGKLSTVGELVAYLEADLGTGKKDSISSTPSVGYTTRTEKDVRFLKRLIKFGRRCYELQIQGKPDLTKGKPYIFAPNHGSHLDTICLYDALQQCVGEEILQKTCCMAAKELAKNRFMKKVFLAIGAVPVERKGNVITAVEGMKECIVNRNMHAIIYPEGTRTRTGELGTFKNGVAKIAIETGTKIIPVYINGAYEIFPPSAKLPKGFRWRKQKHSLVQLSFGPAVDPAGMTTTEITQQIRHYIVEQKGKCDEYRN